MRPFKPLREVVVLATALSACGTTYELPELSEAQEVQASNLFAQARSEGTDPAVSRSMAENRFRRVARRIAPVGKSVCEQTTTARPNFDCDVDLQIDRDMNQRNAYFTYERGEPIIRVSMPLLQDTRSDDEVAFVLGHEYGHLIGQHIQKQQGQAIAGALIMGMITAAATAQSTPYGTTYNQRAIQDSMDIGAAAGSMAYSQTYELESDMLGTRIAYRAGYDPVEGAEYFARPENAKKENGRLSFWGTHPPDEKRIATVLATVEEIKASIGLRRTSYSD